MSIVDFARVKAVQVGDRPIRAIYAGAEKVWPTVVQAVVADDPLLYYRLDEAEGPAVDQMGGPDGEYAGVTARAQPSLLPNGQGACVQMANGTGVVIPDNPATRAPLGSKGYTIELWARPAQAVHSWLTPLSPYGFSTSWNLIWAYVFVCGTQFNVPIPNPWSTTVPSYWAIAVHPREGPQTHLAIAYVNGVFMGQLNMPAPDPIDLVNEAGLAIGGAGTVAPPGTTVPTGFTGQMQELAIYDYPLSEEQVRAHYLAGGGTL